MRVCRTRRGVSLLLVLLALLLGAASGANPGRATRAQGGAFDCPAPAAASPTNSEAVSGSPVPAGVAFPDAGGQLTVFAAASLADAFEQIKTDLEAAHPGLAITYNFQGSQALVTQLAAGAKADAFAAANAQQMQAAVDSGSIIGDPVTFIGNRLVVVTPAENPAGLTSPADLGKPDLRLVLAQPEVPAGRYARAALCAMSADASTYGEGFAERVAANIVSLEEDVRSVLAKVQLGEADAGIVYISDAALAGDAVTRIEIPAGVNIEATYPIATVTGGDAALAEAFIAYVLSPEGQATLEAYGFTPLRSRES